MKKLYHIYNIPSFEITHSVLSEEPPINSTLAEIPKSCIKPMYNPNDDTIYEGATQEEIDAKNLELQKQSITTYKEQWKQDGQAYYDEMQNRIIAMLIGVENAVAIMTEIKKTINPMLEQIQRGNQALAMLDYMDGENNPTIQEVIDLFNEIGQYCITYYQNKYPH